MELEKSKMARGRQKQLDRMDRMKVGYHYPILSDSGGEQAKVKMCLLMMKPCNYIEKKI